MHDVSTNGAVFVVQHAMKSEENRNSQYNVIAVIINKSPVVGAFQITSSKEQISALPGQSKNICVNETQAMIYR